MTKKYKISEIDIVDVRGNSLIRFTVYKKSLWSWIRLSDYSLKTVQEAEKWLYDYIQKHKKTKIKQFESFYDQDGVIISKKRVTGYQPTSPAGSPKSKPPNQGSGGKPRDYGQFPGHYT